MDLLLLLFGLLGLDFRSQPQTLHLDTLVVMGLQRRFLGTCLVHCCVHEHRLEGHEGPLLWLLVGHSPLQEMILKKRLVFLLRGARRRLRRSLFESALLVQTTLLVVSKALLVVLGDHTRLYEVIYLLV